ncbi:MAG: polymerase, partial [Algoriphagus sp.]
MKKLILSTVIAGALAFGANAQEFDKFSLEVGGGFNKPMAPLAPEFLSPTLNLGHVEFGARYMFNEKFGLKLDYGFGSMKEAGNEDANTGSFDTKYYRLNL